MLTSIRNVKSITAVCVLFLIKLRWPRKTSLNKYPPVLTLWRRYFFYLHPGHWVPARLCISRSVASTITDPESHAHHALVDFFADSFDVSYAMQILFTTVSVHHIDHAINSCRSRALCPIRRWNTIACSTRGSYKCGERHSKKLAMLCCRMFYWKCIPENRYSPFKANFNYAIIKVAIDYE